MKLKKDNTFKLDFKQIFIIIMIVGSLWGLSEVFLNETIKSAGLPFRAGILVGAGMLLMGMAMGVLKRPVFIIVIPFLVIALLQLGMPVLGVSVFCRPNSCVAIGLQAFALAGVAGFAMGKFNFSRRTQVITGACAALVSAVSFYFIGLRVAPCNYLLSFNYLGGFFKFMLVEGMVWAAFSAIFFPAGIWLGEKISFPLFNFARKKPVFYYSTASGFVIFCWLVITATIASSG